MNTGPVIHRVLRATVAATAILLASCGDAQRYPTAVDLPPRAITDAALHYDTSDGSAVLEWTAPRSWGGSRAAARYDIRFSYGNHFDWDEATRVTTGPAPRAPGARETFRLPYPQLGRTLRASVRTIDLSGGVSDAGNVAVLALPGITLSGTVSDALDARPLAGLRVAVANHDTTIVDTTDGAGSWLIADLPQDGFTVRVESTGDPPAYFPIRFEQVFTASTTFDLQAIPFGISTVYPTLSRLRLFKDAVNVRTGDPVLRSWTSRPVDVYVPAFVNEHGIDYHAVAIEAIERWMELTGVPLFRVVDAAPATGVTMAFPSASEMGIQIGVTSHEDNPDGTPLRSHVRIVNTFSDRAYLRRAMLHELGHTLRLQHLPSGFLMYAGQPLPDDPTDDEIWITRVLAGLTPGTDTSIYREVGE